MLDKELRDKIEKIGACIGCHQNMSDKALWDKMSSDKTLNAKEHIDKMNETLHKAAKIKK